MPGRDPPNSIYVLAFRGILRREEADDWPMISRPADQNFIFLDFSDKILLALDWAKDEECG